MSPAGFFQFAGTMTIVLIVAGLASAFVYEYYSSKKK